MLVPWSWLKQWVAIGDSPEAVGERLNFVGLEVEGIETTGGEWDNVVVGHIREIAPHPDADRLVVCQVDTGDEEARQIVCGATNMKAGDRVPVALPGAQLGEFKIKKSKLRGVVSEGMMCSARELGLGDDHEGLLILDGEPAVGILAAEAIGKGDSILDLSITPNRGDCLSIRGVAREVAILAEAPLTPPAIEVAEVDARVDSLTSVTLKDPEGCPRYTCRIVQGVTIGPSPAWLADTVSACGLRPINNVVDATNYVLMELGQPLHAFDLDTLAERRIVVRRARDGEKITTLDDVERALTSDITVIADAEKPVAVAGVMGGADTAVSSGTTDLLLESAYFDPNRIRRTSRTLNLSSDSSYRFERGVDIAAVPEALDRLAQIIAGVAGGTVAAGIVDAYPDPRQPVTIPLRLSRVRQVLGLAVDGKAVAPQLEALGCGVAADGDTLRVTVPTWRSDLTREIDLIEEVARLTGFEHVPSTLPAGTGHGDVAPQTDPPLEDRVCDFLAGAGFAEVLTYRFGPSEDPARLGFAPEDASDEIRIVNPLSEDRAVMRSHLLPSLLRVAGSNQRNGNADLRLFEVGTVFRSGAQRPREIPMAGGVLTGAAPGAGWWGRTAPTDFYDAKGAVEMLAEALRLDGIQWEPSTRPYFRPGAQAALRCGGDVLGWVGEVQPEVLEAFDALPAMFAFLLNLDEVAKHAPEGVGYIPFARFPPSLRSRTYDVPEAAPAADVVAALVGAGGDVLERAELTDVYRGENVSLGLKSLTFALAFRAPDRTLQDRDVDKAIRKLDGAVKARCKGTVREG